jgi:hypothetical protein
MKKRGGRMANTQKIDSPERGQAFTVKNCSLFIVNYSFSPPPPRNSKSTLFHYETGVIPVALLFLTKVKGIREKMRYTGVRL